MKLIITVGARPNFMKASSLVVAIREHNQKNVPAEQIQLVFVHTGQHYDHLMSGTFFTDLGLPKPDIDLGIGSASHAVQTAEVLVQFEKLLLREKPDAVVVVGDVNSTIGCALAAARVSYDSVGTRPLIVHVEAGLRSFDRAMPEEVNRVLTDHLSDLLFVTEESGVANLKREGVADEKIHFVGNTMIDSLLSNSARADQSPILDTLGLRNQVSAAGSPKGRSSYALLTLHRPSNVDDRETFLRILDGLSSLSSSHPIIFSAHPRTQKRIAEFGIEHMFELPGQTSPAPAPAAHAAKRIHLIEPLGYLDFLCLMKNAAVVITDSGGIQEETTCLGVPCITVRENTERPVTLTHGTNIIAGTDSANIREAIKTQMARQARPEVPEKWDGQAGRRIISTLMSEFQRRKSALLRQMSPACR